MHIHTKSTTGAVVPFIDFLQKCIIESWNPMLKIDSMQTHFRLQIPTRKLHLAQLYVYDTTDITQLCIRIHVVYVRTTTRLGLLVGVKVIHQEILGTAVDLNLLYA